VVGQLVRDTSSRLSSRRVQYGIAFFSAITNAFNGCKVINSELVTFFGLSAVLRISPKLSFLEHIRINPCNSGVRVPEISLSKGYSFFPLSCVGWVPFLSPTILNFWGSSTSVEM
jgi:hypothetical protein